MNSCPNLLLEAVVQTSHMTSHYQREDVRRGWHQIEQRGCRARAAARKPKGLQTS